MSKVYSQLWFTVTLEYIHVCPATIISLIHLLWWRASKHVSIKVRHLSCFAHVKVNPHHWRPRLWPLHLIGIRWSVSHSQQIINVNNSFVLWFNNLLLLLWLCSLFGLQLFYFILTFLVYLSFGFFLFRLAIIGCGNGSCSFLFITFSFLIWICILFLFLFILLCNGSYRGLSGLL